MAVYDIHLTTLRSNSNSERPGNTISRYVSWLLSNVWALLIFFVSLLRHKEASEALYSFFLKKEHNYNTFRVPLVHLDYFSHHLLLPFKFSLFIPH